MNVLTFRQERAKHEFFFSPDIKRFPKVTTKHLSLAYWYTVLTPLRDAVHLL